MLYYLVTAAISVSAGVIGMGMFCGRRHMNALSERDRARIDYATERRKRLEAEQAHTDLADKHNVLLAKAYVRDGARFVRVMD